MIWSSLFSRLHTTPFPHFKFPSHHIPHCAETQELKPENLVVKAITITTTQSNPVNVDHLLEPHHIACQILHLITCPLPATSVQSVH